MNRALLSRLDVLIASSTAPSIGFTSAPGAELERLIALSTPTTRHDDLRAAVSLAAKVQGNAHRASLERSQRIQAAVWAEDVPCTRLPMPMKRRAWIVTNGISCRREQHELARVPSDRIIRYYLRIKDRAATDAPSPEATCDPVSTGYTATEGASAWPK